MHPCRWENADRFLARADAVVFSREDVGGDESYIAGLARRGKVLVVTDGWHGARLYLDGRDHQIAARTTAEVDPTGAGDVFATAFLLRLAEAGDPLVAARFASVAASMSVEAPGTDAIPSRDQVDAWLEENP